FADARSPPPAGYPDPLSRFSAAALRLERVPAWLALSWQDAARYGRRLPGAYRFRIPEIRLGLPRAQPSPLSQRACCPCRSHSYRSVALPCGGGSFPGTGADRNAQRCCVILRMRDNRDTHHYEGGATWQSSLARRSLWSWPRILKMLRQLTRRSIWNSAALR